MPRLNYTKSGALDMRYSSSKAAVASGYSSPSVSSSSSNTHSYASSSGDLHYKKDGSLDMRYSSSNAVSSPSLYSPPASSPNTNLHHKKDGSLDMRYSSSKQEVPQNPTDLATDFSKMNLHLKKDGTPDMRFASSKAIGLETSGFLKGNSKDGKIPNHIPITKSGLPDMRTSAAKDWVKEQSSGFDGSNNCVPDWIPRIKDGSIDYSKAVTQEYFRGNGCAALNNSNFYNSRHRDDYYEEKLVNHGFQELVNQARKERVEIPEHKSLPNTEYLRILLRDQNNPASDVTTDLGVPPTSLNLPNIPIICPGELTLHSEELGRGAFGTVFKGTWNGIEVAVKKLHLQKLTRKEKDSFEKEIKILGFLGSHPNLVQLHGYSLDPPIMVLEFVNLGSLSHILHYNEDDKIEAKITDGRIKKRLTVGVVAGMKQIHAVNIVHGDLKPQNILVSKHFQAKITDFGLSTLRGKTSSTLESTLTADGDQAVGGTAGYMAPELLDSSSPPELSSDIFSFGVVLNELVNEEEPYSDQLRNFVGRGPFAAVNYAKLGNRPKIHSKIPTELKMLIENCWSALPNKRPTFSEVAVLIDTINFPNSF